MSEPHTAIGKRRHTPMGNEGYCKCGFYPYSTDHAINAYEEDTRKAEQQCDAAILRAELAEACADGMQGVAREFELERDALAERVRVLREALDAIVLRCTEGDKRSDWLPVIVNIAKDALAAAASAEPDGSVLRELCPRGRGFNCDFPDCESGSGPTTCRSKEQP